MPLGNNLGDKSDSRYCGVETEFNDDMPHVLSHNVNGGFDFVVAPLMEPGYRPSLIDNASKNSSVLPFAASDLVLSPSEWSSHVVGKISSWIDLDSEDDVLREDSETTLKQELAWASHLSLQACLLPTPKGKFCANYARCVSQILPNLNNIQLWLRIPLVKSAAAIGSSDVMEVEPTDSWELWNSFRALCEHHSQLSIAVDVLSTLPSVNSLGRWFGEPVKAAIVHTDSFLTNARGYPCLSKRHQKLLCDFFHHSIQIVLSGKPVLKSDDKTDNYAQQAQKHELRSYLDYVSYLYQKMEPLSEQERFELAYRDFLQSPLQPLMDNLEAQTYETFEKDSVKYTSCTNGQLVKHWSAHDPSAYHATLNYTHNEPPSFTIANTIPQWRQAMCDEYSALIKNGTWSLVPQKPNTNVVDCRWVYKLKRDQTGKVTRYKARLVAKGFNQQPGIDYQETFSPVVKATTIRVVLSIATTHNWPLRQMDIQNAFLHGDLKETVYLKQPPGFVDASKPNHVCLLHKALYGLKQAPRAWFHRLSSALQKIGFRGSRTDPSLFTYSHQGTLLYMLVYVDDIILTGNNSQALEKVVQTLSTQFAVKDMGTLSYFLGIEITRQKGDLILSQKKYIQDIITRAGLTESKPVPSPITTSSNLHLGDSPLFDNPVRYRQLVGALQYVTLSRPDITYAVNKVCQFMHAPTSNHWSAVKRIIRYLQGTSSLGLRIQSASDTQLHAYSDASFPNLTAYSDADWAGCPDDRRSTGGYAIYLGSNLVSWSARKQRTVSRSSTESEYKSMADTVAELTWLQDLLGELRVPFKAAPTLWCDNLGATYLSANPVFHARTKLVEVDFHFVREKVAQRRLCVQFISTNDQIADIFTKPLSSQRFELLRSKLRLAPRP